MATESKLDHDEGFENFFNNESLSDRILCIYEVEEVESYSIGSGEKHYLKRRHIDDDKDLFTSPYLKRFIKQEEFQDTDEASISMQSIDQTNIVEAVSEKTVNSNKNEEQGPSTTITTTINTPLVRPPLIPVETIKVEEDLDDFQIPPSLHHPPLTTASCPVIVDRNILSSNQPVSEEEEDSVPIDYITPRKSLQSDVHTSNLLITSDENQNTLMEQSPVQGSQTNENSTGLTALPDLSRATNEPADTRKESVTELKTNEDNVNISHLDTELSKVSQNSQSEEHEILTSRNMTGHDDTLTIPIQDEPVVELSNQSGRAVKRTFTVEKKVLLETKVFVHSIILAAKSDFFKCLFSTSGMKETREKEVKLEVKNGETPTMLIMLRCFYNKNFINEHTLDEVIKVISLAKQYCFDCLIDKCLDVLAARAESIATIEDFNRINIMVMKIRDGLMQHRAKCNLVMTKCRPFLVNSFLPLDESLERTPCKFYTLRLESMNLFLDLEVQQCFDSPHGNLFLYAMQQWVRAHVVCLNDTDGFSRQYKAEIIKFIEKLLSTVNMINVSGDFLTNIMNYEISPFSIWPGYKEWYIRALQNYIHKNTVSLDRSFMQHRHNYPVLTRKREVQFARQEKNADIFSMAPVIMNGFEIGIYLRIREDRKIHMLCKCKNLLLNRIGFDKSSLMFSIKGLLRLNNNSNLWKEHFPRQLTQQQYSNDRFNFSYKHNTMCLQMYALCKLSPAVYNIAKRHGFFIEFDIQQLSS